MSLDLQCSLKRGKEKRSCERKRASNFQKVNRCVKMNSDKRKKILEFSSRTVGASECKDGLKGTVNGR